MPFTTCYLDPAGNLESGLSKEKTAAAFKSRQGMLWVDFEGTDLEDGMFMEESLGFHPLAVEDCINPKIHSPKIDDFEDYLFIIVHGINHVLESDVVETAELAIFLGPSFVVSNHNYPLYSVDSVKHALENNARIMKQGADFMAHAIIDALIDNVMPTIDAMIEIAEDMEEQVIQNPRPSTLEAILKLKRSTIRLHRVMAPQREVLNRLSRGEFSAVRENARIFYRDIYDHIVRIEDFNQTVRDMTDNAMSTYLSSVANRQNEVMKVLSIVAAIFLPLTLLVGIYGMNFEYMPELKIHWAYFAILGFIGAVIISVVSVFWARGWINWGRRGGFGKRSLVINKEKLRGYTRRFIKNAHKKP